MKKLNRQSIKAGFRDFLILSALFSLVILWGYLQYEDLRSLGLSPKDSLEIVISGCSLAITIEFMIGFFRMTRKRVLSKLPYINNRTPNSGP